MIKFCGGLVSQPISGGITHGLGIPSGDSRLVMGLHLFQSRSRGELLGEVNQLPHLNSIWAAEGPYTRVGTPSLSQPKGSQ